MLCCFDGGSTIGDGPSSLPLGFDFSVAANDRFPICAKIGDAWGLALANSSDAYGSARDFKLLREMGPDECIYHIKYRILCG